MKSRGGVLFSFSECASWERVINGVVLENVLIDLIVKEELMWPEVPKGVP